MKKALNLCGLLLAATLILGGATGRIYARLVGTTGAAETCWGAAGAEVCVDTSGNWIPTTANTQALGSSSLPWSNVESTALNSGGTALTIGSTAGSVTIAGTLTEGANGTMNAAGTSGTAGSQNIVKGLTIFSRSQVGTGQSALLGIFTSTTIPVNSTYELLTASAQVNNTVFTMTSLPTIATNTVIGGNTGIPSGTFLVLASTGNIKITLQDNVVLSGSQLKLYGSNSVIISSNSSASFIFDQADSFWHQIAR